MSVTFMSAARQDQVRAGHDDQPEGDPERVVLDPTRLHQAQLTACPDGQSADAVDGPIDDLDGRTTTGNAAIRPPITMNSR